MVPRHSLKWNSIVFILLPTLTIQWVLQPYHCQFAGNTEKMPTAICRDMKGVIEGDTGAACVSFVFPLFNGLVLKEQSKAKHKNLNKEYYPVDKIPNICMAPLIEQCCVSQDCAQSSFLRLLGFFFCITSFLLILVSFLSPTFTPSALPV